MSRASRVACSIDLNGPGRRVGYLGVSFSDDTHAYGIIPVPIAVLAGRAGPTVLLTAGVHGDEHEGQIVLRRLLREIDPMTLSGRIILMPAVNLPAVRAARRTSPLDGGNMNRAFPGSPIAARRRRSRIGSRPFCCPSATRRSTCTPVGAPPNTCPAAMSMRAGPARWRKSRWLARSVRRSLSSSGALPRTVPSRPPPSAPALR